MAMSDRAKQLAKKLAKGAIKKYLISTVGGTFVLIVLGVVIIIFAVFAVVSTSSSATTPSGAAIADIPANYLALYQKEAGRCKGLDWSVLAGIGSVETNHGRLQAPGVQSGTNFAGAAGPMQFLKDSTWQTEGVDGNGDGQKNVYDPADAIPAAAMYLCKGAKGDITQGAPYTLPSGRVINGNLRDAIFTYNHADWYVDKVMTKAAEYGQAAASSDVTLQKVGDRQVNSKGKPYPISVPAGPRGAAINAALNKLGAPYIWAATGPDSFDCSGLVIWAYQQAGAPVMPGRPNTESFKSLPIDPGQTPGDLVLFNGHVGIYLGDGLMVHAPDKGDVVKITPVAAMNDGPYTFRSVPAPAITGGVTPPPNPKS